MTEKYKLLSTICFLAFFTSYSAFGLYNVVVPQDKQTDRMEPIQRTLSLKFPIKDVPFHWEFFDKSQLLAGSLRLLITRGTNTQDIVVFQDGKFSSGWGPLIDQPFSRLGKDPIYFGFKSQGKYLIAPRDNVKIIFVARDDLKGIGSLLTGYLPSGTYTSEAQSGWLTDKDQAGIPPMFRGNAAFENWGTQWSIVITSNQGWTPSDQEKALKTKMKQLETETKK